MTERTFKIGNSTESVDDIMIGIPKMFRDEFIGSEFEDSTQISRCLAHADIAKRALFNGESWKYEKEVKAIKAKKTK